MNRWWRKRSNEHLAPAAQSGTAEVETVDDHNFMEVTSGRLTAVDFWAPWCGPCLAFTPVFDEVARRYGDHVGFAKCNVDENQPVAALLQIQAIPTVVLFGPNGSEINRISGFLSRRQLERMVVGALDQGGS